MQTLHKIGILSDTHGLVRPEVMDALQGCEVILHGGDINKQKVLDQLATIAPVYVVRGNNDKEWAEHIPETLELEVCGLKVFMVHNKKFIPQNMAESGFDLVIYGHSHKYEDKMVDGVRYVNPGSCGPRRFHQEITLAILYVEEGGVVSDLPEGCDGADKTDGSDMLRVEKILIPHPEK